MGNINGKKVLQVVRTVEAGGVEIDDTTTALDKVWSSQKTSDLISVNSDKGIYYTTVAPTESNGNYTLAVSNLANPNQYTQQFYNNLVLYIDSSNNVTELYKVTGVNGSKTTLTLSKVGNFGGGSSIPTITIEATQMISQNQAQLTDEQISILNDNGFVAININGNNTYLMQTINNANAMMFSASYNDINNNEYMAFRSILVIKAQKIANFYNQTISNVEYDSQNNELKVGNVANIQLGGKQLYQHNIFFDFNLSGTNYGFISITIETESNTVLTETTLKDYFSNIGKFKNVEQGLYFDGTNNKNIVRVGIDTNNPTKFRIAYLTTLISGLQYLTLTNHVISNFSDNVIPL